ncbi:hypothetical protein MOV08_25430 [Streptomyces yunnanensis]|uniref:Uncharacterized protein n=1 Tax=Streptomyces yunnanensis TaxID=156453 RepID=A0ABY8AC42_9ACTN|nr:hypothetical protein [Streptomyces yunnanensis]WEB42256.1 hypothetical protein MOV08_25430 [Streptomyces yunnanensis]
MSYRFAKVYRPERSNPAIGNPRLALDLRLWLLALDRVQRGGHAPLGSGELELILTKENGEPYHESRYRQARCNLINAGLLAPSASARCLLIPSTVAAMDAPSKTREECATHAHNIPWDGDQGDWMFRTSEQARRWEAECDNIAKGGAAFPSGEWAQAVRLRAVRSVNGSELSAA